MSTRDDSTLTEAERAAFARLQAQAVADDPSLGAPLVWRVTQVARSLAAHSGRLLGRAWVAPVVIVVGAVAVVVGLATWLPVSILGLVLVAAGAVPVAERIGRRLDTPVEPPG